MFTACALVCGFLVVPEATAQQSRAPQTGVYRPAELLIKFSPEASPAERDARLNGIAAGRLRTFATLEIDHIRLRDGVDVIAAVDRLAADPAVLAVQPNYERRAVSAPNDPYWTGGYLWGLQTIQMPAVWNSFGGGDGSVVIADIDTGVNYLHPDLWSNMWRNPGEVPGNGRDDDGNGYVDDVYGIDTANNDSDPMDDHGHGTHTAGTFAATGNDATGVAGVMWNAKILACKFLTSAGQGWDSDAVACFDYIVALRKRGVNVRVSSNSWGGPRDANDRYPSVLSTAIDAAGAAGILNVFAAGNDGVNTDVTPFDPASFPLPSILSVAASDGNDARAGFSNYGAASVDIAAPGVSILSTVYNTYGYMSGTSMAAPHAAGVAGLLLSVRPYLSVDAAKAAIVQNVDRLPQWTGVVASGGRLNAHLAFLAGDPNQAPAVSLTSPAPGAVFTAPATATLSAAASDADGSVTQVAFYANGAWVGTDTSAPYSVTWSAAAGSYTLAAVATDNAGAQTTSAGVAVSVVSGPASTASFVGTDVATQGSWRGRYGQTGAVVVNDATALPGGVTVTASGHQTWTWASSTADVRALQKTASSDRLAATWYGGSAFDIHVNAGADTRQVALYVLDWDSVNRQQTVEVRDAASNALLDTRTIAAFSGGQYWVWHVRGPVRFRVLRTGGANAVVGGVFVDAVGGSGSHATFVGADVTTQGSWHGRYGLTGSVVVNDATALPPGVTVAASGHQAWTWAVSTADLRASQRIASSDRIAATWYSGSGFHIDVNAGTDTRQVALYALDWEAGGRAQTVEVRDLASNALLDTRTMSAFAGGQYWVWHVRGAVRFTVLRAAGANAVVSAVFLDPVGASGSSASFVGTDVATQGNWKGYYGRTGAAVVNDATALPAGVTVAPRGQQAWTWQWSTGDTRALQTVSGTNRIAATWYGSNFAVDVNAGTETRYVSLYVLDWEGGARAQTVEVRDAVTNALLDTRAMSGFFGGQYWVWQVRGPVRFDVWQTGAVNAVVSGVFID